MPDAQDGLRLRRDDRSPREIIRRKSVVVAAFIHVPDVPGTVTRSIRSGPVQRACARQRSGNMPSVVPANTWCRQRLVR
jgi:hypothetical protein